MPRERVPGLLQRKATKWKLYVLINYHAAPVTARFTLCLVLIAPTLATVLGTGTPASAARATVPRTMARSVTESAGSTVDRATLDFPATHIAFSWTGDEGTGVRYRTVDPVGRATPWRKAREAHDMENGRSHYSGVIQVDRPAHVEWRPVERRGRQVGSITLDYLNTKDGTRVPVARSASARAATTPAIVTRAQWGANESIKKVGRSCRRSFWPVQQLFVHHTAGSNFDPNPRATMRAIYWYHTVRRGWCDIGYNFVIGWDGVVYEGRWARRYRPWEVHTSEDRRGRAVRGAHVSDFNTGSVGISLMGNFSTARLPARMRGGLVRLLAWEADRHNLLPRGQHVYRNPETGLRRRLPYIAGHRHAGQTACPGGNVYRTLPSIRRAVKRAIGRGRASTSVTLTRPAPTLRYGSSTRLSGRLARRTSTPMPGREVALYTRARPAGWRLLGTVSTDRDGRFSRPLTPGANTEVVAVFRGGPRAWGSQSGRRRIAVRPAVTLLPEGAESTDADLHEYPPGTTHVSLAGEVRPAHPGRRARIRVSRVPDTGGSAAVRNAVVRLSSASRFRYTFGPVSDNSTYRAVTSIARHRDHAASSSSPRLFSIGPS